MNYDKRLKGARSPKNWLKRNPRAVKVLACIIPAVIIAFIPAPAGVERGGMIMPGIFIGTILGFILQRLPNAPVGLIGVAAGMVAGVHWAPEHIDAETRATVAGAVEWGPLAISEVLAGFGNSTAWLIAAAFIIADGFVITGLGRRIALMFLAKLG